MNEKDKPLTKADLQIILDHITTERKNLEKYVNEELAKKQGADDPKNRPPK